MQAFGHGVAVVNADTGKLVMDQEWSLSVLAVAESMKADQAGQRVVMTLGRV